MEFSELGFLVVEDNAVQRETLVGMLQRLGARSVLAAADGKQALQLLDDPQNKPEIVISDLEMPTMDGMEFIRHLGGGRYPVSLIVVSAHERGLLSSVETMAGAYGVHLLGTIEKPVAAAGLTALVARHVPPVQKPTVPRGQTPHYTLDEILDGLAKNQFEPFFQPKLEVATHRVVGAEALARWRHPQHGIVLPGAFIRTLEEHGRIDTLMWAMLGKSVAFCNVLGAAGFDAVIAVNLSLKSLADTDVASRILEITRGYSVEPKRICLEVTESAVTTDVARALENLTRLRMNGFGLSIDDYGTGYSSMQQLTRIPFTELKIDGSFVTNASTRDSAKIILASSLTMARKLNIVAVAEGVESQQDWDLVSDLGCDLAQGYFIAGAMAARDYVHWQRNVHEDPMSIAKNP